ncbi:MAG: C10 family peptidase [Bacteroidales bacterium]|nr:C10 family peptidase [Bacteroidales bacterium]
MNIFNKPLKTILLIIIVFSVSLIYGNPVDQNRALKVGMNFLKHNTDLSIAKNFSNCRLAYQKEMQTSQGETVTCFYIFNIADKGFVIVSADDAAKPILGYSTESSFDCNDIPENMSVYLNSYTQSIIYAIENQIVHQKTLQEWNDMEDNRFSTKVNRSVEPLLGTLTWHQNCYYNSLCPEDPEGNCGHVYAGCVATAMAQIIKFWGQPVNGSGTHSYSPSGYPQQNVNYGTTTYNYSIMPDHLDSTSSEEEIFAVAQLQWHCGVAVDMMYGNDGSGAYSNDVPEAMVSHFNFGDDMDYCNRDNYSLVQWQNKLKESFDIGYPVYYCAQDDNGAGGHAFVCDGYDENDFFHFNWGWNGRDNGYYAIDALNPTSTEYQFNTWQAGIFNMIPNAVINAMAQAPANFTITPAPNYGLAATLNWTNPSQSLDGNPLTSITSIEILRNGTLIHSIANPTIGAAASWTDNTIPQFGGYTYIIYAVTETGNGATATQMVGIGPFCPVSVELNDSYGDGWNGASISFLDETGNEAASVTILNGSTATESLALPQGMINCVWTGGSWDNECSFSIFNGVGEQLFACNNAESLSGTFFSFDNQCENPPIECVTPTGFSVSFDNESSIAPAVLLNWDLMPMVETYKIYRVHNNEYTLVATTNEEGSYIISNFSQNIVPLEYDSTYCFAITSVCENGESDFSNTECTTIISPCDPPSNLIVSDNGDVENLLFTLQWDNISSAISYQIFRNETLIGTSTETTFEDSDIQPNVTYNYTLITVCEQGISEASETVTHSFIFNNIDENQSALVIYPNPARQKVMIEHNNFQKVMIYNILGELMEITESSIIDVQGYENGIYIFRLMTKDGSIISQRLIIQH